jgi:alpha-L-rhamnosidase
VKRAENVQQPPTDEERRGAKILPVDKISHEAMRGAFSDGAPCATLSSNAAPAWGGAGVIVPWTMYRMYGDRRIIETSWEAMTHWMDYLTSANPAGLRLARNASNFGDWLALDVEADDHQLATCTPKDLLATAYYAYTASLMAEMARVIARPDEAVAYEKLHKHMTRTFVTTYVQPDGRILSET